MKRRVYGPFLIGLTALSLTTFTSDCGPGLLCTYSNTWQVVDDYVLTSPSSSAIGASFATDPQGAIYVAGYAKDASGKKHGIIRKSSTGLSGSWTTLTDYQPIAATNYTQNALWLVGDTLFTSGSSQQGPNHLLTRSWTYTSTDTSTVVSDVTPIFVDNGVLGITAAGTFYEAWVAAAFSPISYHSSSTGASGSWGSTQTTPVGSFTGGQNINGVFGDASGNAFLLGMGTDGSAVAHFVTFKVSGGSATLVDDPSGANGGIAVGGWYDSRSGAVYTSGNTCSTSTTNCNWIIRKSTSAGASGTWTTVDDFQYASGQSSSAHNFSSTNWSDIAGGIWVAGYGNDSSGNSHWIVRYSANGSSWSTHLDYQLASGSSSVAYGIGRDRSGNLFSYGTGADASGSLHWIVQRLACR